jgi:AcrR family transcriptional regulator
MARLTRAQQQVRTRATVVAAARAEFASFGYTEARIDRIVARSGLTRGALYANFPSKRALYLAVLLDLDGGEATAPMESGQDVADLVEAFARVWLERLPLVSDAPADARLRLRSLSGVFGVAGMERSGTAGVDEFGSEPAEVERAALAGVARLEELMVALAWEGRASGRRLVRLAGVVRTLLDGVRHQAEVAPGVVDPFDVVRACRHLASLDLGEIWEAPHRAFVGPAEHVDRGWTPPRTGG